MLMPSPVWVLVEAAGLGVLVLGRDAGAELPKVRQKMSYSWLASLEKKENIIEYSVDK